MKRALSLILIAVIALSLTACGGETTGETAGDGDSQYYQLGDTVSTERFAFTLEEAVFTIALSNVGDETYFSPKEYNAQADANNPYVAPKGHTWAAFTYTVTNLDRASAEFHSGSFVTAEYQDTKASNMTEGAYYLTQEGYYVDVDGRRHTEPAEEWISGPSMNMLLSVGETESRRAYVDLPVDVTDLQDSFLLTVRVPDVNNELVSFTYQVDQAGRQALADQAQAAEQAAADAVAPIEEALQGAWTHGDTTITFADGRFTYDYIRVSDGQREINEGDYIIGPDTITLAYDSGYDPAIDYTFADGVLTLHGEMGSGEQFTYTKQ